MGLPHHEIPSAYILHENDAWLPPLRAALNAADVPFQEWHLDSGLIDLDAMPPEGVFYNRMSASSHTRGHRYAPELTATVLAWLEGHGRQVLNGSRALGLEVSKTIQHSALRAHGIRTPATVAAVGIRALRRAAEKFTYPGILKPNRGGKGLGVTLVRSQEQLLQHLDAYAEENTLDGHLLLQQYIPPADQRITRVELVGREFVYAVRVDASKGFELCPADACGVGDSFCPTSPNAIEKFEIDTEFADSPQAELIPRYQALMKTYDIDVAGFEFVTDADGTAYTYDINTNTNYNGGAEARAKHTGGMAAVAELLRQRLVAPRE